ncbi:putative amidase [Leptodontidium sp. MPI-SDFR-AT-0119]|nr:putative amidase [Leptodontidium sp. MPI-SDFR-AT-0119]
MFLHTCLLALILETLGSAAMTHILDGKRYYVHPAAVGSIKGGSHIDFPIPAVLLSLQCAAQDRQHLCSTTQRFDAIDDVFTSGFTSNLILQSCRHNSRNGDGSLPFDFNSPSSAHETCQFTGDSSRIYASEVDSCPDLLPAGPYFILRGQIHQAWRLYEDVLDAFVVPVAPENPLTPKSFKAIGSVAHGGLWKEVAVPSRLYHSPSKAKPLAGTRVSIKDIFHLEGIRTTFGSRDWTALHGPDRDSADYVKNLISLGAIIVGKTTSSIFAGPDMPTDQWIDFHSPFSPRGDGYQSPMGSSAGAGASLAGYEWLDISIGTDSGGSIRAPAAATGLYGLRTSWNATSMKGVEQVSQSFDVVGLLGRSLDAIIPVAATTFGFKSPVEFPTKIIYPTDFFPHEDKEQQAMVESFVSILETFLGTKRVLIGISDLWDADPPIKAKGRKIKDYLEKSAFWPYCYEFYHSFDEFRELMLEKFGRQPYGGPTVQYRWDIGSSMTAEDCYQGQQEQNVFRDWFEAKVLHHDPDTLSNAILVLPYGLADPAYRDVPNNIPGTYHTLTSKLLSPVLQIPQLVFPIGQKAYLSKISNRIEHIPIACTLLGARGSDLMLMKLGLAALKAADWPTEVLTGRYTFGNSSQDRADVEVPENHPEKQVDYLKELQNTLH